MPQTFIVTTRLHLSYIGLIECVYMYSISENQEILTHDHFCWCLSFFDLTSHELKVSFFLQDNGYIQRNTIISLVL